jgi:hypothetical protein
MSHFLHQKKEKEKEKEKKGDNNTCICESYLHNEKYLVSHSTFRFFFPHMHKVSQLENFMAYNDMLHNLMKTTM